MQLWCAVSICSSSEVRAAYLSHVARPDRKWRELGACRCALQAPLAGEIIAYLAEEGDPVEYRQELVEIAPYFGALGPILSLHGGEARAERIGRSCCSAHVLKA